MPSNPKPLRKSYPVSAGKLSGVHFGPAQNPVRLIFLHANGFNAYAYRELLQPLGVHVISLDLPGHGMSEIPTDPARLKNFKGFADNVAEFIQTHIGQPVCVAGHSLGAATAVILAAKHPNLVRGLTAFDPPTLSFLARNLIYLPGGQNILKRRIPIIRNAGRRRTEFESLEAAYMRYENRGTFKGFSAQALRDYLKGGLIKTEAGVRLACAPEWEQAVFSAQGQNLFRCAKALPANSRIIYAGKDGPTTQRTRGKMAKILGEGRFVFEPDFYHLFPLQHPDYARDHLRDMLRAAN